ncbi:glycosyltransferase [Agromyces seonyuensis]|uniref:Glycosyltransferase n=1 Tax=Agromyces seonyuensis TaxID=2662446 RepID=A0A6I4NRM0_9MICO|nr:glycosyltransferase [Agromyces seonyuensis]MWB97118.1 glycosyltransferase [Agromyces seonyuensis]
MPRASVVTPSHDPRFLDAAAASLRTQTLEEWEWIVLLNGPAEWAPAEPDERIRVIRHDRPVSGVGEAKRFANGYARGDVLVEFDHDDVLLPGALERVVETFEAHPEASLVYSHAASIDSAGDPLDVAYNQEMGWQYAETDVDGVHYRYPVSFPPTPHNVSYIWFAPNHVRAFRRDAYVAVGGHDASLAVLDDHELMSRLYQAGPFVAIDECLYLQRIHDGNTHRIAGVNAEIQQRTVDLYDRHFEANALAWARREGLACLDLGAAHAKPQGYLGVDQHDGPGVDVVARLPERLDLPDSSVGVIRAVDFFEHVADKIGLINELHRLLVPGGVLITRTPSTDGRGAFQDPTHVAFYNENSFWYYSDENYTRYVPEIEARFQVSRLHTHFPTEWHRQTDIPYVVAHLLALKPGAPPNGGPVRFAGLR